MIRLRDTATAAQTGWAKIAARALPTTLRGQLARLQHDALVAVLFAGLVGLTVVLLATAAVLRAVARPRAGVGACVETWPAVSSVPPRQPSRR